MYYLNKLTFTTRNYICIFITKDAPHRNAEVIGTDETYAPLAERQKIAAGELVPAECGETLMLLGGRHVPLYFVNRQAAEFYSRYRAMTALTALDRKLGIA